MSETPLELQTAMELRRRLGRGEIGALELLDACTRAFERANPRLNAVVTPLYELARSQAIEADAQRSRGEARGALHGLPVALKDMTETAGVRTTYGSRAFAHHVPDDDALLVQRLRHAGALVVAKTNTPEFAVGINTTNRLFGTTLNPFGPDRTSGGSSGGSAVSLATGMCVLAEGSDHGGSIRIPAALNNVVGLRTSPGRIPSYPNDWVFDPFCVNGPMARSVDDAAMMLSVMAGPDARVPISIDESGEAFADIPAEIGGWRVAFSPTLNGLFRVDPEVGRLVGAAAGAFSELGCTFEQNQPDLSEAPEVISVLRAVRTAAVHQRQLDAPEQFEGAWMRDFLTRASRLSVADVGRAEALRSILWQRACTFFESYRLLLLPTTQFLAFPADRAYPEEIDGKPVGDTIEAIMSTYAISILGLPALSVPCGLADDGTPVGLQIVGGWRRERDVLQAGAAFERLRPWRGLYQAHRAQADVRALRS